MQRTRHAIQGLFLLLVLGFTARNLAGFTKANVESFCPVGGLEGFFFYLKTRSFLCATSGVNFLMFLAVLIGTVFLGRVFCSWVCPVGTLMELLSYAGISTGIARKQAWKGKVGFLRWVKYPVLILVLYFTHTILDLVFRSYCPYYAIFSGQSHELAWWSKWLMLGILALSIALPFFWCRVLCPFGAFLSLGKTVAPICPGRKGENCHGCRQCEKACPQEILVLERKTVRNLECTHCLSCIDSCPTQCLSIKIGYGRATWYSGKSAARVLAVMILVIMFGGIVLALNYPLPTYTREYQKNDSAIPLQKVEMIVKGVRCRRSSMTLGKMLEPDPGIVKVETYVSEFRAVMVFDPAKTSGARLQEAIQRGLEVNDKKTGLLKRIYPFEVESVFGEMPLPR